jgi:hypothetical protein
VQALSRVLKGETSFNTPEWRIERSLPHGHVAAVLGMARKLGLHRLLPARLARLAQLALAMVVARVIEPAAKLATARQLSETTASHSLGAVLDLGEVDEDELYAALDLLGQAQPTIEAALARRHLQNGCLVLYDLISSYLEGRCCELARFGYSRDGQPGKPQIVFGLLCAAMAARSRSKCLRATPQTRPCYRPSQPSCANASASSAWSWSATAA